MLDLGAKLRLPGPYGLHQRCSIPVGNRVREGGFLRGGRARLGGLLKPFEHCRFRGKPLPADLAAWQAPPLQQSIHRIRRDREPRRRQMNIQDVRPTPSGGRGGSGGAMGVT